MARRFSPSETNPHVSAMEPPLWHIVMVFAQLERGRASEELEVGLSQLSSAVGRGIHVASQSQPATHANNWTKQVPRRTRRIPAGAVYEGPLNPRSEIRPIMRGCSFVSAQGKGWSALARS